MAYLVMMTPRLVEMRRVLRTCGTLYLHCDPTASHYLKILLDAIFTGTRFRNEISLQRHNARSVNEAIWPRLHDVILHYGKGGPPTFNPEKVRSGALADPHDLVRWTDGKIYRTRDLTGAGTSGGETGRPWRGVGVTVGGRHWRVVHSTLDQIEAEGRIH